MVIERVSYKINVWTKFNYIFNIVAIEGDTTTISILDRQILDIFFLYELSLFSKKSQYTRVAFYIS